MGAAGAAAWPFPSQANAAVPLSTRFDLTDPSDWLIKRAPLHNDTVCQGLGCDNVNDRYYVPQRKNGSGQHSGDLCVTKLTLQGRRISHMYLKGFGHGGSIGVEPSGSSAYLWTEFAADDGGYGTRIARFKWQGGTTLTPSSNVTTYNLVPFARHIMPAIDPVTGRLILRYRVDGRWYFSFYDLSAVKNGSTSPLATVLRPDLGSGTTYQGFTAYGSYLYLLQGEMSKNNTSLATVNINTGLVRQLAHSRAGGSLDNREPEGMGIRVNDEGAPKLVFSFASGRVRDRRFNLFRKERLII